MRKYTPFPTFETTYTLEVPQDTLWFESRFESGNLAKAIRTHPSEYDLYLSYDTETKGHTQWYYFSVSNASPGTYTFNIVNLLKYDSLYNEGLLPAVKSVKGGGAWHRDGFAVSYFENARGRGESPTKTYTLSFAYTFQQVGDTVYFAHCIPYTFTDLCKYLDEVRKDKCSIARVSPMCKSIAGNVCEVVTITHNIATYRRHEEEVLEWAMSAAARRLNRQRIERQEKLAENLGKKPLNEHKHKQGIVFTARVHPGETPGSFMAKGVIDFLLSEEREAKLLRKHYVFKIIPMLNPDGVRYGNYRCSVLGVDLNRRWDCPSKLLHPTIYHTKRMIQAFSGWHNLVLFCDFHGHSCKRGIFAYGCAKRTCDLEDRKRSILARMIPLLLSQRTPVFSLKDCHFRIQKAKESTARVVAFKEMGIVNSYTIEASFYGPKNGECFDPRRDDCHMTREDYESIGKDLCIVSLAFASKAVFTRKLRAVSDWLRGRCNATPSRGRQSCKKQLWLVTRSKSLQEALVHKTGSQQETVGSSISVRSPPDHLHFRPSTSPCPEDVSLTSLSELESIQEGNEEDEVLSVALQESTLWEDLLDHDAMLDSSGEDQDSDSAPSEHGEALHLPTPKHCRRGKKKKTSGKTCKTEPSEDKGESEERIARRSSNQALKPPQTRVIRQQKSPRGNNGSIVTFAFVEDATRVSADSIVKEAALRKRGRLAELLRGPDLKEESPLQVNGRARLTEREPRTVINHYSYMALQRQLEKQESPFAAGNSSRVISANHVRRRWPGEGKSWKSGADEMLPIHRRVPKLRQMKAREIGTTIEEVLQSKEQQRHSEYDPGNDSSLLGVLPRFRENPHGLEQFLREYRKGGKYRLIGKVVDRV